MALLYRKIVRNPFKVFQQPIMLNQYLFCVQISNLYHHKPLTAKTAYILLISNTLFAMNIYLQRLNVPSQII